MAGESPSDVVVSTEGTEVVNNGSGSVTDGEGGTVVKPGEEATTPGGSTSGGGGVTPAPDLSKVTVAIADAFADALGDPSVSEITVSGVIGSTGSFGECKVDRPVSIKGAVDSKVYGSFVVTSDDVSFEGLAVSNKGDAESNGVHKNAINAACGDISVTGCVFYMSGSELANAISIWPTREEAEFEISDNKFNGYTNSDGTGFASSAIVISGGIAKESTTGISEASKNANMDVRDDQRIIFGNKFTNCRIDYDRVDWSGGSCVWFAHAILFGNNLSGLGDEGNGTYCVNASTERDNASVGRGVTLVVKEGVTLAVNSSLANVGTIKGSGADAKLVLKEGGSFQDLTAGAYVWSGTEWAKLSGEASPSTE